MVHKFYFALKQVIRVESIIFTEQLKLDKNRVDVNDGKEPWEWDLISPTPQS